MNVLGPLASMKNILHSLILQFLHALQNLTDILTNDRQTESLNIYIMG